MTDGTCLVDGVCEVTLETSDRSALEAFYTSVLGLKVLSRERDRTWLACGSRARLGLWTPGEKEFGDEGGRHVHFALSVPPGVLDDACVRMRELGVGFQGPVEHSGGDRSLYCEDPAGNVLELWDFFERDHGTQRRRCPRHVWRLDRRVPLGDNAHRGLAGPRRLAVDAVGYAVGLALAGIAAVRRGKAVHPHGAVYEAQLVVPSHRDALGRTELFGTPGRRRALVRFSRSLGLPRPLPDLLGMSVRVLDAYGPDRDQDFLLVTSVDAPVLHHLFVPASDVQQRPYSSSLPYRVGDDSVLVGALPRPESPRVGGGDELERLAAAAATGRLVFDLAVAGVWGRFRPVAELRVGDPLPHETDALRFNPWNAGGGLEPTGLLNRLRDYAYPLSQRAWGNARRANDQAAAETVVKRQLRA